MTDRLIDATLDSDEDGFTLILAGDDTDARFNVGFEEGRQLLASLEPLREWIAEGDAQRRSYDAASPEERDRVLGRSEPATDAVDAMLEHADLSRKAARENGDRS